MNKEIKVLTLEECIDTIKQMIRNSTLIPVIGSGFSAGNKSNNGYVPSGKQMKGDMLKALFEAGHTIDSNKKTFSQIAKYYNRLITASIRKEYVANNFIGVTLQKQKKEFLKINWPYIYTLNIDDAIEKNSKYEAIGPNKHLENLKHNLKIVYKLHGNANDIAFFQDGDLFSIFDSEQYINSLTKNGALLNKLKQDYIDKNIIFIGCSLDDEIDIMHVFSLVKQESPQIITEKYYLTTNKPSTETLIDLESYGITTVILLDSYDELYDTFISIKEELKTVASNELDNFKNIKINFFKAKDKHNKDYILFNKIPFDKKSGIINLPSYFISRNLSITVINNISNYCIQFICGKRVSGKSFLLLDLYNKIADRDKYYFDSREKLSKSNIETFTQLKNIVIFIDTGVLSGDVLSYILRLNFEKLIAQNISFIISINTAAKESLLELRGIKDNARIKIHYLENKFASNGNNDEYENMKKKLTSINMPFFHKNKTILDSLLWIQEKISKNNNSWSLKDFSVDPDNYLHIAYLILLAHYGKLTSADLVKFDLDQEPNQLMPKLDKAVEPDYRYMITASTLDNSYYQIVCNAQVWLLGYLSKISLKPIFFDGITKAVIHIVKCILETTTNKKCKNTELYEFIRFDNINLLFGGARGSYKPSGVKKLIQNIYSNLKELLGEDYQFNHQHAKCLLWGIEEVQEPNREQYLTEALNAAYLSAQLIDEALVNNPKNNFLKISEAHVQFTISMINVKIFFFNKNISTFKNAVIQLRKSLAYKENENAYELYDNLTEDENDFSISKFMDYLLSDDSKQYNINLNKQISWIVNFRYNNLRRNY